MKKQHLFFEKRFVLKKNEPQIADFVDYTIPIEHVMFHIELEKAEKKLGHMIRIAGIHPGYRAEEHDSFNGTSTKRQLRPTLHGLIASQVELMSLNEDMTVIFRCELLQHGFDKGH